MSTAFLVVDSMRKSAGQYRDMQPSVFDAFIPVNLGHQYLMGRTADYWVLAPGALGAMGAEYKAVLNGRIVLHEGSQLIELSDYLNTFFSDLED